MKVAGSSWWILWSHRSISQGFSISILIFIIIFNFLVPSVQSSIFDSQCSSENISPSEDQSLIKELADASVTKAEITSEVSELLEPYDATPFWYNMVQAVMLASGMNPTTQHVMHELATSSFYSSALNDSIRKMISYIKCGENKTLEVLSLPNDELSENSLLSESLFQSKDFHRESEFLTSSDQEASNRKQDSTVRAVDWSPKNSFLSRIWNAEDEPGTNSILGPINSARLKRELRDGRKGIPGVMADFHQPFFMSESGPSSLVTRDPAIISVSGCPSGHIKDLRGACRQIFQYTVNFGVGARRDNLPSTNGIFGYFPSRTPPLSFRRPPSRRPQPSTLRDIARDSSLFKHSVLRGYVPPFVYPPRFPQPSQNSQSSQSQKDNEIEPMEIIAPEPQIVMIDTPTVPDIIKPESAPSLAKIDQSQSQFHSPSEKSKHKTTDSSSTSDKNDSKGNQSKGGGSSEQVDSSYSNHKEFKSKKKSKESNRYTVKDHDDDD